MTSNCVNETNKPTGITSNNALSLSYNDLNKKNKGRMALFFKSVRGLEIPTLYQYMSDSINENIIDSFLIAFNTRDCRGGKGERALGRKSFIWLFINKPLLFRKIIHLIPEYGRWDDLLHFFPRVLNLQNIEYVRNNFCSLIENEEHLITLQVIQKQIVNIFVLKIKHDYTLMLKGKPCSIAAKWAPTEGDSLDKKTGVYKTLAKAMNIPPRTLRKVYLTPLRAYLKIVETYMCSGKWDEINYNKVPSCAMKRLKKSFEKHDKERFNEWKTSLNDNSTLTKVNAKQLFPHELIKEIRVKNNADEVCEAQWKILEKECLKGNLIDSIAVIDTSSSMFIQDYLPFDVAIALGLIISSCDGVFKNHVITFNTVPEFIEIKDGSLFNRWKQIYNIPWGGSTDILKTFEIILNKAKTFNVEPKDMPKTLWIISDMQFNSASKVTNFEAIDNLYKLSGYIRPQIIFWNVVGSSTDFPVNSEENGTSLISGFSPSIMKAILSDKEFTPFSILQETLNNNRLSAVKIALEND